MLLFQHNAVKIKRCFILKSDDILPLITNKFVFIKHFPFNQNKTFTCNFQKAIRRLALRGREKFGNSFYFKTVGTV